MCFQIVTVCFWITLITGAQWSLSLISIIIIRYEFECMLLDRFKMAVILLFYHLNPFPNNKMAENIVKTLFKLCILDGSIPTVSKWLSWAVLNDRILVLQSTHYTYHYTYYLPRVVVPTTRNPCTYTHWPSVSGPLALHW